MAQKGLESLGDIQVALYYAPPPPLVFFEFVPQGSGTPSWCSGKGPCGTWTVGLRPIPLHRQRK